MIWYKYSEHDYMDEYPSIGYRLFEDAEQASKWEAHMNSSYSGGTTTIIGPATKEEILRYVEDNKIVLDTLTKANIENDAYYKDYQDYLEACENAPTPDKNIWWAGETPAKRREASC